MGGTFGKHQESARCQGRAVSGLRWTAIASSVLSLALVGCGAQFEAVPPGVIEESLSGSGVASHAGQNLGNEVGPAAGAGASEGSPDSGDGLPPSRPDRCEGILGLDVSAWNPGTDWSTARSAGARFAYIKATEGTSYVSGEFKNDWPKTREAGVLRGAYHFFRPKADPTLQAQLFMKIAGVPDSDDLPPMFDWEVTDGVSPATQAARALTWLELVERASGKTPIIYTGPSFWSGLGNPSAFARFPLFIAHYGVACPRIPATWGRWTFWQRGVEPFPGAGSSKVDVDLFNGNVSDLLAFARRRN